VYIGRSSVSVLVVLGPSVASFSFSLFPFTPHLRRASQNQAPQVNSTLILCSSSLPSSCCACAYPPIVGTYTIYWDVVLATSMFVCRAAFFSNAIYLSESILSFHVQHICISCISTCSPRFVGRVDRAALCTKWLRFFICHPSTAAFHFNYSHSIELHHCSFEISQW